MLRLCAALIFLLIISCKKDSNNNFSILGKWELAETYDANTAWGGCSCWKATPQGMAHTLEFSVNGTYQLIQPIMVSSPGCTDKYERKNDSTIVWNRCGANDYEAKISHEGSFLLIEEHLFAGYTIYKYKRLR